MAMVKGAVATIKKDGPDAAYAEISNKSGKFVDRDLYVVVYRLDGHVLAHGANAKLVGTDQSDAKDVDGKAFVQERIALAQKQPNFWQAYKFKNPVTEQDREQADLLRALREHRCLRRRLQVLASDRIDPVPTRQSYFPAWWPMAQT